VGHALLIAKLASLPSRAHPIQEWRDAGEMEYYYESNQIEKNDETMSHGIKVQGHGTAQPQAVESLLQGFASSSSSHKPHKAIEDGHAPEKEAQDELKEEADDDEDEKKMQSLRNGMNSSQNSRNQQGQWGTCAWRPRPSKEHWGINPT
jgi:hypothetical protein